MKPNVKFKLLRKTSGLPTQKARIGNKSYTSFCASAAQPHSTTHVSPYEALNSRKLKTWLPETPTTRYEQQQSMFQDPSASLAQRDALQKQKMKIYDDQKGNAQERKITPGEVVLMQQHKQNKLSTPYNPKPFCCKGDERFNDHSKQWIRHCHKKFVTL